VFLETVKNFGYLGFTVTDNNIVAEDIKSRIKSANITYFQTRPLFSSRPLSWAAKLALYKTLVKPVLLFSAEAWTLTDRDKKAIVVFKNKILRRIFWGITDNGAWRIRSNEEIHRLYDSPTILNDFRTKRLQWSGHVHRRSGDRLLKLVWESTCFGRSPLGRQKLLWTDKISEDLYSVGLNKENWLASQLERHCQSGQKSHWADSATLSQSIWSVLSVHQFQNIALLVLFAHE